MYKLSDTEKLKQLNLTDLDQNGSIRGVAVIPVCQVFKILCFIFVICVCVQLS